MRRFVRVQVSGFGTGVLGLGLRRLGLPTYKVVNPKNFEPQNLNHMQRQAEARV